MFTIICKKHLGHQNLIDYIVNFSVSMHFTIFAIMKADKHILYIIYSYVQRNFCSFRLYDECLVFTLNAILYVMCN